MSLNAFNSSLQNTSWSATATDLYTGSTVSYNNFSVSPLDEIEKNFTAAIEKFSNLTEVDYTTEEDGFTTESLLQKIKNVTTSIINTISSAVPSTIIDTTTEDKAIAFLSTTGTQKTFSEDLSTEEGSGTDQISTVQTEEESTTFQSASSEDVSTTDRVSTTTTQTSSVQTEEESTTFQSASSEDVSTTDRVSTTTTQTSSVQAEEESTTFQSASSEDVSTTDRVSTTTTQTSSVQTEEESTTFQSASSEDVSTTDRVSTTTTQTSSVQAEEESTTFQSASSEDVSTTVRINMTTQNTTEGVIREPPAKNFITMPVIAILTGAASMLVAVVACVYRKINKPRAVTVLPRQDRDVEMSLLKKN